MKYRFYEPGQPPVQKVVKGNMNRLKTLKDRRETMRALLAVEDRLLSKEGYHPGKNEITLENNSDCHI